MNTPGYVSINRLETFQNASVKHAAAVYTYASQCIGHTYRTITMSDRTCCMVIVFDAYPGVVSTLWGSAIGFVIRLVFFMLKISVMQYQIECQSGHGYTLVTLITKLYAQCNKTYGWLPYYSNIYGNIMI